MSPRRKPVPALTVGGSSVVENDALVVPMDWSTTRYRHEWKRHIGKRTRELWYSFSDIQKKALAWDADDLAQEEALR